MRLKRTQELRPPAAMTDAGMSPVLQSGLHIDARNLLSEAGADTLLISETGALLAARSPESPLVEALEAGNWALGDGLSWTAFRDELRTHAREARPLSRRIIIGRREGPRENLSFDLVGVPVTVERGRALLVIANETTLERNLVKALIASRQLFRDLVSCSADFTWETNAAGVFTYVGGGDAAGYSAHELNGRQAASLLGHGAAGEAPIINPFATRQPLQDAEIWVWAADGRRRCMVVSAVPVTGDDEEYLGARGVCRDVTSLREQDAEIASAREREVTVERAVGAIRQEIAPDDILTATASALLDASGASAGACLVLGVDGDGALDAEHQAWAVTSEFGRHAVWTERGTMTGAILERLREMPVEAETPRMFRLQALGCLGISAAHQGRRSGAVCLLRSDEGGLAPWPSETIATLRMLIPSLGLALAQAAHMRGLEVLSRVDSLTGVFNRRSFEAEVTRRLQQATGEGVSGALVFLDFDGFKAVNDTLGHARGDEVLRQFGDKARALLRPRDIVARLGGDEFAAWLDGANEAGAKAVTERLCQAGRTLRSELELPEAFSASAGIALYDPEGGESLDQLEARADAALYAAKRAGKNGWVLADAPLTDQPGRKAC